MSGHQKPRVVVSAPSEVIAGAEVDRVVTARAGDDSPAAVGERRVGAVASDERVIAAVAADGAVVGEEVTEHAVDPATAEDQVVAAIAGQVAGGCGPFADDPVVAELSAQIVVASETADAVVAGTRVDNVGAR